MIPSERESFSELLKNQGIPVEYTLDGTEDAVDPSTSTNTSDENFVGKPAFDPEPGTEVAYTPSATGSNPVSLFGCSSYKPQLTPRQEARLNQYYRNQRARPIEGIAMRCKWDDCNYKQSCPLYQMQVNPNPQGQPCPMELGLIEQKLYEYQTHLDIRDDDIVDLAILKEYISWMIFSKRAEEEMVNDPDIIRSSFGGIDPEGNVLSQESSNPAIGVAERATRIKQKLLDSLMATREAKAKDRSQKTRDVAEIVKIISARVKDIRNDRYDTATPAELTISVDQAKLMEEAGLDPSHIPLIESDDRDG